MISPEFSAELKETFNAFDATMTTFSAFMRINGNNNKDKSAPKTLFLSTN